MYIYTTKSPETRYHAFIHSYNYLHKFLMMGVMCMRLVIIVAIIAI